MAVVPMGDLPRYHAERKPGEATAIWHPQGALTWWELEQRSNQRARLFREQGVGPGDLVTVALSNGDAFFESMFAIWKLGATPNPVSPKLPHGEAAAILDLVKPALLVAAAGDWPAVRRMDGDIDVSAYDVAPLAPVPPAASCKAMTSGGSTGRPKIIVDHAPAVFDPELEIFGMRGDDVVLNPGPLYHNAPFSMSHIALFKGCTVIGMQRFDAEEALRLIKRHRVSWVTFVPTMMHRIWMLPEEVRQGYGLNSLRLVWHMAAPMPRWLKQRWIDWLGPEKIWEGYGGTEGQGSTTISGIEWLQHPGSVGRIQPERIRVLRPDACTCDTDETGEIYFLPAAGSGSSYHYVGADPKRVGDGWESLGDLGWVDADGYLYIADRRVDLILRGGANIYPAEVEAALDEHPAVASSAVVGLPHESLGQTVHAIVQARDGVHIDLQDLQGFLADRLTRYKLPESYEFSETPLRDDAGKIRRVAVRDERERWLAEGRPFQRRP